ncbi:MAG: winged helix-turn-helix transcriptional regulator [Rhodospirillaceae bacterium]|nr:winged helix-turn-helix transcriptional regulator [Rhodospirillaceae bacterium]MYB14770.1 winged helix-turn-helix transcriptional regulator [Rhodospirillaceae bacterium]MYI50350.1 winged helix-turn-helix transcriptional regulator [Rhodospirillaceae bacterium]
MDGPKPADRDPGPRDSHPKDRTPPDGAARRIDGIALHETPGHLLRRAQQRAVDLFVQAVGERGLRPPQFALLLAAWQNPDANQSELVRITGIDRSTAADMITRLAGRGLIRRVRTEADGRANRLSVTAEGVAALEAAADRVERAQENIVAPIPVAERARFLRNLARIADLPGSPAGSGNRRQRSREGG